MNIDQISIVTMSENPQGENLINIGVRENSISIQEYGTTNSNIILNNSNNNINVHNSNNNVIESTRTMRGGTTTTSSSSGNSIENLNNSMIEENGLGLIIETTTWSRDSHELFDYEAQHINNKKFLVNKSSKIFRQSTECMIVGDEEELPTQGDYLLSIKTTIDGKFVAFPADRSLGICNERQLIPKKVWLIVRDLPSKSYALQPNDLVKLGRFKLRVKQLVKSGDQIPELRLDEMETSIIEPTIDESLTMQCRICLTEGEQEDDPLLCPCQCRGSIKFVHLECLRHWINGRLNLSNDNNSRDTFFFRQLQCELCKSPLPSSASIKGSRVNIVKVPQTKPPFIVLENIYGNVHRGVHVISMAEKKDLKLGRGHESDVRISDVSISRYHATIRYRNENFMLEDHDSKFGTLVSVRRPQAIENNHNLSLQVGRTVVNLRLSEEPCSPNIGIKELPVDSPKFHMDNIDQNHDDRNNIGNNHNHNNHNNHNNNNNSNNHNNNNSNHNNNNHNNNNHNNNNHNNNHHHSNNHSNNNHNNNHNNSYNRSQGQGIQTNQHQLHQIQNFRQMRLLQTFIPNRNEHGNEYERGNENGRGCEKEREQQEQERTQKFLNETQVRLQNKNITGKEPLEIKKGNLGISHFTRLFPFCNNKNMRNIQTSGSLNDQLQGKNKRNIQEQEGKDSRIGGIVTPNFYSDHFLDCCPSINSLRSNTMCSSEESATTSSWLNKDVINSFSFPYITSRSNKYANIDNDENAVRILEMENKHYFDNNDKNHSRSSGISIQRKLSISKQNNYI